MKDLVARNWKTALTEVMASLVGAIFFLLGIALILYGQGRSKTIYEAFLSYFTGGQLGLSVLSLSGIIFLALRKHGSLGPITTIFLYIFYLGPVFLTAVIIGMNPGFKESILSPFTLAMLWLFFVGLHILWFVVLILEPFIPSPEQAGEAEENLVGGIAERAAKYGK